jgi:23S rRNA-/tRNA-specific pseudouridylate synthase
MMRLDKYLAERTGMTRSESRKAVTKGRVSIDGAVCRKADTQLDEHTAAVALDGVPLAGAYRKFVYIMLNKPEGVVSAKVKVTVEGILDFGIVQRFQFGGNIGICRCISKPSLIFFFDVHLNFPHSMRLLASRAAPMTPAR